MGPGELVAGFAMIKILFVESYDFKFDPMMLAVAGDTGFGPNLFRSVESLALVDARFQLGMAIQTFLFRNFAPQFMALGAIADAFQMAVAF